MTSKQKTTNEVTDTGSSFTGRVKWFNNKAGYGFITVVIGDRQGEDIFVHHSGVQVGSEQYKYLVQGEYVEFSLKTSDNTDHPFQAFDVTGVGSGKLMCETRTEQRQQRDALEDESGDRDNNSSRQPKRRQQQRRQPRRNGPRDGDSWGLDSDRGRNTRNTHTQSA